MTRTLALTQSQKQERARVLLERLKVAIPDARCELIYFSHFQLLVSVVLSAKNTDKQVNKVMQPLYEAGFTPETVLAWGEAGLLQRIRSIGLAPTKAKNVHNLSRILQEQHGGQVPSKHEELVALPGVGRKTANVVMAELFQHPSLAVDTHVYRVTYRLGLQDTNSADKAERELLKVIDPSYLPGAHHLFLLHGRYVCKAIKPTCTDCVLKDLCPHASLEAKLLPKPKTKAKAKKKVLKKPFKPGSKAPRASRGDRSPARASL